MEGRKKYLQRWRQKKREEDKKQGIIESTIRAHKDYMPRLRELARADLEDRGLA